MIQAIRKIVQLNIKLILLFYCLNSMAAKLDKKIDKQDQKNKKITSIEGIDSTISYEELMIFDKILRKEIDEENKKKKTWNYLENNHSVWPDIDSSYSLCKTGKNQSPINITSKISLNQKNFKIKYKPGSYNLSQTDRWLELRATENSSYAIFKNNKYFYNKLILRCPSEHAIKGIHSRLEIQLMHYNKAEDTYLIISVLYKIGKFNNEIHEIISRMKINKKNYNSSFINSINHVDFLPKTNRSTYKYNGSLTYPPCKENVIWLIMTEKMEASIDQINFIKNNYIKNNRPIQNLNNRIVIQNINK